MSGLFFLKVKSILNDRVQLFWSLVFPLLLGTMFYFTFGTLLFNEETPLIKAAAVRDGGNEYFGIMLDALSGGDDPLLDIVYAQKDDALKRLKGGEVHGVFIIGEEPKLIVSGNGVEQTVLGSLLNRYASMESTIKKIIDERGYQNIAAVTEDAAGGGFVERRDLNTTANGVWRENFYALIAMTCLYAGYFGLICAARLQPGSSGVGLRRAVSPVPKSRLILSDALAALLAGFCIVLLLIFYIGVVLKVDLGRNTGAIILTGLAGAYVGVMLGMFIGVAVRAAREKKDFLLTSLSLILCFFAGLMYPTMRLMMEHSLPWFNRINPAALITDSFYALDAYGAGRRFYGNIITLFVIGAGLTALSVLILRRKKYADI